MVAQVDKKNTTVVTNTVYPTCQTHCVANVGFIQVYAGMAAISVHELCLFCCTRCRVGRKGRKIVWGDTHCRGPEVKRLLRKRGFFAPLRAPFTRAGDFLQTSWVGKTG